MNELAGVLTAMVTPFAADGALDEAATRKVARYLLDNGSHGLVVCGTTGESPTLSDEEIVTVLRIARDEAGPGVPIVCGAGSNNTAHAAHLASEAAANGADAVLVVTPYYNKPNRAGVRAHFETVAAAAGIPLVVYNIPSRVIVNIPPEDLADLATIEHVDAVKQANNDEVGAIEGMTLLAGNDDVFLPCLEAGGAGGILVASHVAGPQMREIYDAFRAGDLDRARQADEQLRPLYAAMGTITTNPIPVKAALDLLGVCSDTMRLPMIAADNDQRARVRGVLEAQGLLSASRA